MSLILQLVIREAMGVTKGRPQQPVTGMKFNNINDKKLKDDRMIQ